MTMPQRVSHLMLLVAACLVVAFSLGQVAAQELSSDVPPANALSVDHRSAPAALSSAPAAGVPKMVSQRDAATRLHGSEQPANPPEDTSPPALGAPRPSP